MRTIHVLRKPCSEGTVAANVLRHGTGAINVDGCRVSTSDVVQTHSRSPEASAKVNRPVYGEYGSLETHQTPGQALGRWPANVILQHLDGCRCMGTAKVGLGEGFREAHTLGTSRHDGAESYRLKIGVQSAPRGREGETTVNWICVPGCPVAALDRQSGRRAVSGAARVGKKDTVYHGNGSTYLQEKGAGVLHDDFGGASRFFQHVRLKPEGG